MRPIPYLIPLGLLLLGRLFYDLLRSASGPFTIDSRVSVDLAMTASIAAAIAIFRWSASPLLRGMRTRHPGAHPILIRPTPSLRKALDSLSLGTSLPDASPPRLRIGLVVSERQLEFWTRASGPHTTIPLTHIETVQFIDRSPTLRLFSSIEIRLVSGDKIELIVLDEHLRRLPFDREQNKQMVAGLVNAADRARREQSATPAGEQ